MRLSVVASGLIGQVGEGSGEELQIIHYERGGEDHIEVNGSAGEGIIGAGGHHHTRLLGGCGEIVFGQTEIDVSAAGIVLAVGGYHVGAFVQQVAVDLHALSAHVPSVSRGEYQLAVDVKFKGVIVLVGGIVVGCSVYLGESHCATNPDVGSFALPFGADVGVVVIASSPCGLAFEPG